MSILQPAAPPEPPPQVPPEPTPEQAPERIVDTRPVAPDSQVATADLPAQVSAEWLMQFLRKFPAKRAAHTDPAHADGLMHIEDWIELTLRQMRYPITTQEVKWSLPLRPRPEPTPGNGEAAPAEATSSATREAPAPAMRTYRNIVAEIPGTDLASEVLIVGAHHDAVVNSPGADDNASGAAALMEVARVLQGRSFRRTVRLVFFTLEEAGLLGSTAYAMKHLPEFGSNGDKKLIGMVSLEMLGFFCDTPGCQRSPVPAIPGVFEPPTVGDSIVLVTTKSFQPFAQAWGEAMRNAAPGLKTFNFDFSPVPTRQILRSDHAPFLLGGHPALMLTDTANFRNPNYHKPTDTVETLDVARYTLVVRGVVGAIVTLAEPAQK